MPYLLNMGLEQVAEVPWHNDTVTCHWSDGSLVRRVTGLKAGPVTDREQRCRHRSRPVTSRSQQGFFASDVICNLA